MPKLTIDLPDDLYKELLRVQYEQTLNGSKRVALGEIIRNYVAQGLVKESNKKKPE